MTPRLHRSIAALTLAASLLATQALAQTTEPDTRFKRYDKNNDGKLSRDEYPQPGVFDAVDANKDGFATQEEVRAYFRNRRGN